MSNDEDQYVTVNGKKIKVESEIIYLSSSGIREISDIKGLDSLSNIKELYLNDNYITKIYNLEPLNNLERLELSMNQIEEIQGLDSLVNLKVFNLSRNKIQKIKSLDPLVNLKTLNLDYNRISIISGLDDLIALETLGLSHNQIFKIENLQNLANLNRIDLAKNQITIIGGLENNSKLKHLYLYMNFISKIEGLEKVNELKELSLFDNNIKEISNLSSLRKLKNLSLRNNNISNMNGIEELDCLEELDLVGNQISEIKSLEKLKNLRYLMLADNEIVKLEGLNELINLEILNLNYNEIFDIEGLNNLKNLKRIDLSNNYIKVIKGIENLENLEEIHLKNNKIRSINRISKCFKLRVLDLRDNKIEESRNFIKLFFLNINLQKIDLYRMKDFNGVDMNIIHRFLDKMIVQYLYFYSYSKDKTEISYNEVKKEHLDDILSGYNMKLSLTVDIDERRNIQKELQKYIDQRINLELEDSKLKYIYTGLKNLVSSLLEHNLSSKLTFIIGAEEEFEKSRNIKLKKRYKFALKIILLIKSAIVKENFNVFDLTYDLINSFNEIDDIKFIEFGADSVLDIEFIDPIINRIISFVIEKNRTYYLDYKSPERFEKILKDKSPRIRKLLEDLRIEEIYIGLENEITNLTTLKLYFAQMNLRKAYYNLDTAEYYQEEILQINQQIKNQLEKAIKGISNFIIFPEYAFPSNIIDYLIQFSKENNIWIIGGCERFESEEYQFDKTENITYIISPSHPPIIQKKRFKGRIEPPLKPGNKIKIIHSEFGTFTILICADFLEDYLLLLIKERVDFIVVPSFNKDIYTFKRNALSRCVNNCCFIFINNMTQYPDSSIFAPYKGDKEVKMHTFPFFEINLTEFTQHRKGNKISKKFKPLLSNILYDLAS